MQDYHSDHAWNIAAALQQASEDIVFHQLDYLKFFSKNIILTGGVAQNSVINGKAVNRYKNLDIFVPSIPHDAGCSLGAAIFIYYKIKHILPSYKETTFLGNSYSLNAIKSKLSNSFLDYLEYGSIEVLARDVFDLLKKGKKIAIFRKEMECGPRALGHRSIIALPIIPNISNILNEKVKYREWFRPYGVIIPPSKLPVYFDVNNQKVRDIPYMSFVFPLKKEYQEQLAPIMHIDKTCRVQTMNPGTDKFFDLLFLKMKQENIPEMIINTSLNVQGAPIARTPEDAISTFFTSSLDALIFNDRIILKK